MSTDRTALTRLTTLFHSYDARGNDLALDEAQQGLLADILSLPCLQDRKCEKQHEEYKDWCSYCDVVRIEAENNAAIRQELQDYFMGGDVGVDDGDSK